MDERFNETMKFEMPKDTDQIKDIISKGEFLPRKL